MICCNFKKFKIKNLSYYKDKFKIINYKSLIINYKL